MLERLRLLFMLKTTKDKIRYMIYEGNHPSYIKRKTNLTDYGVAKLSIGVTKKMAWLPHMDFEEWKKSFYKKQ